MEESPEILCVIGHRQKIEWTFQSSWLTGFGFHSLATGKPKRIGGSHVSSAEAVGVCGALGVQMEITPIDPARVLWGHYR